MQQRCVLPWVSQRRGSFRFTEFPMRSERRDSAFVRHGVPKEPVYAKPPARRRSGRSPACAVSRRRPCARMRDRGRRDPHACQPSHRLCCAAVQVSIEPFRKRSFASVGERPRHAVHRRRDSSGVSCGRADRSAALLRAGAPGRSRAGAHARPYSATPSQARSFLRSNCSSICFRWPFPRRCSTRWVC